MSTRTIFSTVGRLVIGAACMISTGCGNEMLRTGRSPVYLVVDNIQATPQGGAGTAFLISDVRDDNGGVINDNALVTLRSVEKNPSATTAPINSVTLTRYHVDYRRTDGRNVPGVDVPYSFDGALSLTIPANGTGTAVFEIVRHQAKLEPPLKNLDAVQANQRSLSGLGFLSTIAEITIYGRDGNGNELAVAARLDVHFGDFATQ